MRHYLGEEGNVSVASDPGRKSCREKMMGEMISQWGENDEGWVTSKSPKPSGPMC